RRGQPAGRRGDADRLSAFRAAHPTARTNAALPGGRGEKRSSPDSRHRGSVVPRGTHRRRGMAARARMGRVGRRHRRTAGPLPAHGTGRCRRGDATEPVHHSTPSANRYRVERHRRSAMTDLNTELPAALRRALELLTDPPTTPDVSNGYLDLLDVQPADDG